MNCHLIFLACLIEDKSSQFWNQEFEVKLVKHVLFVVVVYMLPVDQYVILL